MSKKTVKRIHLIYGSLLSLLLVVTGVLLMVSCVNIYNIGPRPFTVENISAAFEKIQLAVYITIGAVILGIVLKIAFPEEKGKTKAVVDRKSVLTRLSKKLEGKEIDESFENAVRREKRIRLVARIIAAVVCLRAVSIALIYTLNFDNFTMDYNASVIAACLWVFSTSLVALGACLALVYVEKASYDRQIKTVKAAIVASKSVDGAVAEERPLPEDREEKPKVSISLVVRLVILAVALVFIVLGILNGGMADVLSKAINICTECIGLG